MSFSLMFGPRQVSHPRHQQPMLTLSQKGALSVARERPYNAQADFEIALTHFPDHGPSIVGLSNILMDIYSEKLLPPPAVCGQDIIAAAKNADSTSASTRPTSKSKLDNYPLLPTQPLGLGTGSKPSKTTESSKSPFLDGGREKAPAESTLVTELPPPHKATSRPPLDRLAARDRAYMLLSGLTKLGSGWNYSEAWFALARAYEESGQPDKARDALWWCVELEDARGARDWSCVGTGGYVL